MHSTRKTTSHFTRTSISLLLLVSRLSGSPETPPGQYDGKRLFGNYCAACHQGDGSGTEDGPPPLEYSPWIKGPKQHPIRIVLDGLHGPIIVNDKLYNLEMPGFGAILSDSQLSSILTYARQAFGRQDDEITAQEVAKYRSESADRKRYWTASELLVAPEFP